MSLVATQEGCSRLWLQIWGITALGNPWVHLYGSSHTPAHTDTYSTYSAIELSSGGGYAAQQLTVPGTNWTIATVTAGAQATYITLTWTFTGAESVYGYWLGDSTNTYSLWAEQFAAAFVFPSTGGTFTLSLPPTLTSTP
jgi:hypothetical protein